MDVERIEEMTRNQLRRAQGVEEVVTQKSSREPSSSKAEEPEY